MTRRLSPSVLSFAAASSVLALAFSAAAQQPAGPSDSTQQGGGQGGGNGGGNGGGTSAPTSTAVPQVYGVVAPPPPGEPVGGGNATESSARPVTGDKEDGFDFQAPSSGNGTVHGGSSAVYFDHPHSTVVGAPPPASNIHTVQKGETLWGICEQTFNNPYAWPKIWSYNPQVQNPHWIYPNEQLRLKPGAQLGAMMSPQVMMPDEAGGDTSVQAHQAVAPGTIFLRDQGFINDDATLNWGEIMGSPQDKMYLSDTDEAYVRVAGDHDVKIGTELTVFRPIRKVGDGQVIQIQGTLKVDDWNPSSHIARAQVIETLDAIERGARVGPVMRSFEVVAPKKNDADVQAHVMISSYTHAFFGQNSVVFIDQGTDAGLAVGNRLFIIRRGDAWRQTMDTNLMANRIKGESEEPAVLETPPAAASPDALPEEVTAELRVVNVQKKSATCLVTQSRREIEIGELAVARKGY